MWSCPWQRTEQHTGEIVTRLGQSSILNVVKLIIANCGLLQPKKMDLMLRPKEWSLFPSRGRR